MIYTDQLSRKVNIQDYPTRIVSLVPSITELLSDLSLEEELVGITKFCIHPENIYRSKTRVGGTKKINHKTINNLHPDLIIASKEENVKEDIEELAKHYPVYVTDVKNLEDAINMIVQLGEITNRVTKADEITGEIKSNFSKITPLENIKTLYLIWKNPFISVGDDTFINALMQLNGMTNVLEDKLRYPELTISDIRKLEPQIIVLSSEPYPFNANDIEELKTQLPELTIVLGDGEYFSWYGSRLIDAPKYFNELNQIVSSKISELN